MNSCFQVFVFTGARSEYYLLEPLIRELANAGAMVTLIVSGSHFSEELGYSYTEIDSDCVHDILKIELDFSKTLNPIKVMTEIQSQITRREIFNGDIDLLIVLGDRYESLAVALSAFFYKVPIAHLHGGEVTKGAYDDQVRNCLSMLATFHFPATAEYQEKLLGMSASSSNVKNFGSLGVENLESILEGGFSNVDKDIRVLIDRLTPFCLVTLHPETVNTWFEKDCDIFFEFLEECVELNFLFTSPGLDLGYELIIDKIETFVRTHPSSVYRQNLGQENYFFAASNAAAVIGNTSSGMIELPSITGNIINVGNRQAGRVSDPVVTTVNFDKEDLHAALNDCINLPKRRSFENPYSQKNTAAKIAKSLMKMLSVSL